MTRRLRLELFTLLCLPIVHAGAGNLAAADCRITGLVPAPAEPIVWKGPCKDGFADGKGVLEWRPAGQPALRLEGVAAKGKVTGDATLTDSNGLTYIGTVRDGQPNGFGYFKYPDGVRYEGEVANGLPEGSGVKLWPEGSRYEGNWKQGKRNGVGRATFALGGSYEGEWMDDRFEGTGAIVYAGSGRKYIGDFHGGRVAGLPPRPAAADRFALKEDEPHTGTHLKDTLTVASIPLDANWDKLGPALQERVKSWYPALEEGDEPPYPERGIKPFFKLMHEATMANDLAGDLTVLVTVEADGKASSASSFGPVDDKLRYFASVAAMAQGYKPAKCRGQPCKMVFAYELKFVHDLRNPHEISDED